MSVHEYWHVSVTSLVLLFVLSGIEGFDRYCSMELELPRINPAVNIYCRHQFLAIINHILAFQE
jgi:hypothetical protein